MFPLEVTEHVYIARTCPQQRLGVNLVSLIATLREETRLPPRTIRWYLEAMHGLRLSLGPSWTPRNG